MPGQRSLNGIRGQAPEAVRRSGQDNLRAPARYGAQAMSWDEITPAGGPEIVSCADEPGPLTLRSRPEVQASMIRRYEPRVAAPGATGSGLPGRRWGVTRQALLLDVKQALVDEFVDAEGA